MSPGVPIGAGQLLLQYGVTNPEGAGKAATYGIGYTYSLSKRTTLYATHGRVDNNAGTDYALQTAVPSISAGGLGGDPSGLAVGIAHRF